MAGQPVVISVLADASNATQEFNKVGAAADAMGKDLAAASAEAQKAGQGIEEAGGGAGDTLGKMAKLGAVTAGVSLAMDDMSSALSAVVDLQNAGKAKAMAQARATGAVEQASLDAGQAIGDLQVQVGPLRQLHLRGRPLVCLTPLPAIDDEQCLLVRL